VRGFIRICLGFDQGMLLELAISSPHENWNYRVAPSLDTAAINRPQGLPVGASRPHSLCLVEVNSWCGSGRRTTAGYHSLLLFVGSQPRLGLSISQSYCYGMSCSHMATAPTLRFLLPVAITVLEGCSVLCTGRLRSGFQQPISLTWIGSIIRYH